MRKTYTRDALDAARRQIAKLPAKRKASGLSMREVVEELGDELHQALASGYTVADVADVLTEHGMAIKAGTLRSYLSPRERQPRPESSRAKNRDVAPMATGASGDQKAEIRGAGMQSGKFEPRGDREQI